MVCRNILNRIRHIIIDCIFISETGVCYVTTVSDICSLCRPGVIAVSLSQDVSYMIGCSKHKPGHRSAHSKLPSTGSPLIGSQQPPTWGIKDSWTATGHHMVCKIHGHHSWLGLSFAAHISQSSMCPRHQSQTISLSLLSEFTACVH